MFGDLQDDKGLVLLLLLLTTCDACCSAVQSMSLGAAGGTRHSRAQLVAELAYNPEEIKARLAGIPVYTVANKQNEFVLVAGEVWHGMQSLLQALVPLPWHNSLRGTFALLEHASCLPAVSSPHGCMCRLEMPSVVMHACRAVERCGSWASSSSLRRMRMRWWIR